MLPLWPSDQNRPLTTPGAFATLTTYRPSQARETGASFLVLPGGGYTGHADHEGHDYALWLAQRGIAATVLAYRLGSAGHRHPAMLQDAARALRHLRATARAEGRRPDRIGIIGSSAGGHLAATLATLHAHPHAADPLADPLSTESARPDAVVLCYPVISLHPAHGHLGSRDQLLGPHPSPDLLQLLSPDQQVTPDHPPTFFWHTTEDAAVKVENSLHYALALRQTGIPLALHCFTKGGHGLGLGRPDRPAPPWAPCLEHWLGELGWLTPGTL